MHYDRRIITCADCEKNLITLVEYADGDTSERSYLKVLCDIEGEASWKVNIVGKAFYAPCDGLKIVSVDYDEEEKLTTIQMGKA
jgi:hypothetical protein